MQLPLECSVNYYKEFVSVSEGSAIYNWIYANCFNDNELGEITLEDGTVHRMDTRQILFVDRELTDYSLLPEAHGRRIEWPLMIVNLRDRIENLLGMEFDVCLCIYYHNGDAGMGFHSDVSTSYGPTFLISSISLGEKRTFVFRKKSDHSDQYEIELANGSLLVMGDGCQETYEHALPVDQKCLNPRINLTFRMFSWPPGQKCSRENEKRLP